MHSAVIVLGDGGVLIKLDAKGQERGKNSDKDGQGVDCLENKKIFMDIICVSSHSWIRITKNSKPKHEAIGG